MVNEDDVALVTGGSRGLGAEIVKVLLKRGVGKVIILDLIDPFDHVLDVDYSKIDYHPCDLRKEDLVKATIKMIIAQLSIHKKCITICVNNAGIRHSSSFLEMLDYEMLDVFNVNTMAQLWILKCVLKHHINKVLVQSPDKPLCIVSISSVLGLLAPRNLSAYSASKAALIQMHEAISRELSHIECIRLLLVNTGQLSTGMFSDVLPPRQFFAPVVNHRHLAREIVSKIERGERGILCEPIYSNFLPLVKCMPLFLQDSCRAFSGMDNLIISEAKSRSKSID